MKPCHRHKEGWLNACFSGKRPFKFENIPFPSSLKVAVIAPHPDDFDAIAASLRILHLNGNCIELLVLTSGDSGVEDAYAEARSPLTKGEIREREQIASCRFFGLPESQVRFLRLAVDSKGNMEDSSGNFEVFKSSLPSIKPDIVFMPHGNDTNSDHRNCYAMYKHVSKENNLSAVVLLNRDPKTISMRTDLITSFSGKTAEWKKELLRFHDSQQQRNLRIRGSGFDDRILQANAKAASDLVLPDFAETFEIEIHR